MEGGMEAGRQQGRAAGRQAGRQAIKQEIMQARTHLAANFRHARLQRPLRRKRLPRRIKRARAHIITPRQRPMRHSRRRIRAVPRPTTPRLLATLGRPPATLGIRVPCFLEVASIEPPATLAFCNPFILEVPELGAPRAGVPSRFSLRRDGRRDRAGCPRAATVGQRACPEGGRDCPAHDARGFLLPSAIQRVPALTLDHA